MDQPNSGQIDVIATRDGWDVRTRGQVRESFESHLDAINWACHLAKAEGEELVIHAVNWLDRDTPAIRRRNQDPVERTLTHQTGGVDLLHLAVCGGAHPLAKCPRPPAA